jgi:hypothetical protein
MNNLPDEDPKLINFFRQNHPISPPESPALEDRLMSQIDMLITEKPSKLLSGWRRYLIGGMGVILTGVIGMTAFQLLNPPEPSIAELHQLNLYLEAYLPGLDEHSDMDMENYEDPTDL